MSEFKKVPTLLDSQPPSWSDPFLLLNKTPSFFCIILAILVKPFPRKLVSALLPYPNFVQRAFWPFQSYWRSSFQAFPCQYSSCPISYYLWEGRKCCSSDQITCQLLRTCGRVCELRSRSCKGSDGTWLQRMCCALATNLSRISEGSEVGGNFVCMSDTRFSCTD